MTGLFVILFLSLLVAGIASVVVDSTKASRGNKEKVVIVFKSGRWLLLASIIPFLLASSYTQVDAGSVGVVKMLGSPVKQIAPGGHFLVPFMETNEPVAVQTRIVKPNEDAASLDLQIVHTEVTLAYRVDPAYATFILVSLNNDPETRIINPAIFEAIKSTTAQYDVQSLISKRPLVRDGIENFVKAKLEQYHIIAETVSITDFRFSDQFEQAIEAKVTAQQQAEKAANDLNRIKIEADQKVAAAEGEAKALASQRQQITPELLQLRTIEMMKEKWNGQLPTVISGSGSIPMLDILKAGGK